MENLVPRKSKNKKPAPKPKPSKKRKSDGPTCSMFLAEISRKLAFKKRQEDELPKNIVQTIIESITNALPVKFSNKSPLKRESPMKIETLQTYAPELLKNDTLSVPHPFKISESNSPQAIEPPILSSEATIKLKGFKMPKMPLLSSDVFKHSERLKAVTEDVAVNTGGEHDVASEIAKHVGTLRKISLIAEEFNQKTAKNLKEIVDSVQEDLLRKLEEAQAEQRVLIPEKPLSIDEQQELL
ncbi:jg17325 [Pararge aegeria aegeria]|uniref:Jg17325 protein n=1 Tax=Pararge aegeria aegeria TaxID=348720 RepID=A0A8S4SJ17_9NEOP|nr:jg17325 [Pararge aegeria aegeria]